VTEVRDAHAAGRAAALALKPPTPNPYTPTHVPVWQQRQPVDPRTQLLARAWTLGYEAGQAEYARQHGLRLAT
jgi:hypothetical protein